ASVERAFENREPPVGLPAEQKQLPGLVRGEGEAEFLLGEPIRELARARQFESRFGRRRHESVLREACRSAPVWPTSPPRTRRGGQPTKMPPTKPGSRA